MFYLRNRINRIFKFVCAFYIALFITLYLYALEAEDFTYESQGKRDPFVPLIGLPQTGPKASEVMNIEDLNFQGVALDSRGKKVVILNGEMLTEGTKLDALKVLKITDDEVVLLIKDKVHILKLYEKGGE